MVDNAPSFGQNLPSAKVPKVTIHREFGSAIDCPIPSCSTRWKMDSKATVLEVIEAVIRAINPGLKLRDMFEIKTNLTLPQLKTILK